MPAEDGNPSPPARQPAMPSRPAPDSDPLGRLRRISRFTGSLARSGRPLHLAGRAAPCWLPRHVPARRPGGPMKRTLVLAAAGCLTLTGLGASSLASPSARVTHANVKVCGAPSGDSAACLSTRHDTFRKGKPTPAATTWTSGYGAADLQAAYALTSAASTRGLGATVAIVDAFDDPTAAADIGVYRNRMGLPATTNCVRTSTSIVSSDATRPCFAKVNQSGGTSYPRKNGGWAQEISLDVDMASAICPRCNILLVEASSNSFRNLASAVSYASKLSGVVSISNSYGGSDSSNIAAYEQAATTYHKAVTASTGDNGYGVEAPASFFHALAPGGAPPGPGGR